MLTYYQAIKDYESSLFEEPMSEEEWQEKINAKQDYLEHMANNMVDERRLKDDW